MSRPRGVRIKPVIPDGTHARQVGDILLAINGVTVRHFTPDQLAEVAKGPAHSTVSLTLGLQNVPGCSFIGSHCLATGVVVPVERVQRAAKLAHGEQELALRDALEQGAGGTQGGAGSDKPCKPVEISLGGGGGSAKFDLSSLTLLDLDLNQAAAPLRVAVPLDYTPAASPSSAGSVASSSSSSTPGPSRGSPESQRIVTSVAATTVISPTKKSISVLTSSKHAIARDPSPETPCGTSSDDGRPPPLSAGDLSSELKSSELNNGVRCLSSDTESSAGSVVEGRQRPSVERLLAKSPGRKLHVAERDSPIAMA